MTKSFIILLGTVLFAFRTNDGFLRYAANYKAIDMDGSGKVYLIDDKYDLMVLREKDTLKKISLTNYGFEPMIDASNPLEIFIFYPNAGKVLWLDNQLNPQGTADVFSAGINQPVAFGRANDGHLWVFDNNSKTLKKLNREGAQMVESVLLPDYTAAAEAGRIYDNGEFVLLPDGAGNIYVFGQNLVLKRSYPKQGKLLGLEQKEMYLSKEKTILRKEVLGLNPLRQDTLGREADSLQVQRMNAAFILSTGKSAVFLQPTKL